LREAFRRFWGERKSWDLLLSEFYAMRRMKDETISSFSRRFPSIYYKFPKEIQPLEDTAKLCYATTLHPYVSFLLMERRSRSLQQMFSDAQEVEDNIQVCGKLSEQIQNEELDAEENDSEHEQRTTDLNFEQRINSIMHSLEVFNVDGFAGNYFPPIEECHEDEHDQQTVDLDLCHHEKKDDCFIYLFEVYNDNDFAEMVDQLVEDQIDAPSSFLVDEITKVFDVPVYDEYDDDYIVDFEVDFSE
jgi:hypothetical protein